eukprot:TRINITY_DN1871_c0_g2_i2.p1 TRINITY_DN1871_c0_g2~~TRINITY_DN1871_c0_g2_i2.p1  ORF type:complete len:111 (+),score=17.25 TRINITY_DN1871_c0_g2_i2:83-415(+)
MFRLNRRLLAVSVEDMQSRLGTYFTGSNVAVEDSSGGCGASFKIEIESNFFRGKSLPVQHKMVVACLKGATSDSNFPAPDITDNLENLFVDENGQEQFHSLTIKTKKPSA